MYSSYVAWDGGSGVPKDDFSRGVEIPQWEWANFAVVEESDSIV